MKIIQIRLFPLQVHLKRPFIISLGTITHAKNLIVEIQTENGMLGLGECSPYSFINGEMVEGQMVLGEQLAKLWLGKNSLAIGARMAELDGLLSGNWALKSAFDMALYDLAAKKANMPLFCFLGGENNRIFYSDRTVSVGEPKEMAAEALGYLNDGFRSIKVKLAGPYQKDLDRIKAIRKEVGDSIPLRLDANQAWSIPQAVRTLRELESLNIEHCEEPIQAGDLKGLRYVRQNSPIPIMADESLFNEMDAMRLVQEDACDYFNIKLSKSGGISNALKISAIAEAAGIPCQVGCFSESKLAITALVHFILAKNIVVHYDLDSPMMFSEDPVDGGVTIGADGKVELKDEISGIGATIRKEFINEKKMVVVD